MSNYQWNQCDKSIYGGGSGIRIVNAWVHRLDTRATDKQMTVCLSVILADGELNSFVVRSALLLYTVAQFARHNNDARKTGKNTFSS
jgi:hypothetical protein